MGPTAGLVFTELGADVVKVEPAPKGDHTRGLGGFFAGFNRNKRSLAVDLRRKEGQAVIRRLVPTVDVILENFGPGTMERLGCGYEQLAALNPRLVYLALKGYLAGPYAHRPALDEVVQFQTGLAFMTGPPGQPLRDGASVIDIMGAIFGVVAAQAALCERDITGKDPAGLPPAAGSPTGPASSQSAGASEAASSSLVAPAMASSSTRLSVREISELSEHGDALLRTGDIASARLFYKRAAAAGDGRAALRLGARLSLAVPA
jgi:hypothetical protein